MQEQANSRKGERDQSFGSGPRAASGALRVGSRISVRGATPVLDGVTASPVRYRTDVVCNYRSREGSWLLGGAPGCCGGVLTAAFPGQVPARLDASARDHEPPAAGHPVGIRQDLRPYPARTARHTAPYLKLVDEPERRGRRPGVLAAHARARTESR
ncbi:hypothetical protein OIE61_14710 [Streptomyces sp. NBC_01762]|uniref:hypothetical protein n=1 Tax=unclassified Streptomyces TaxID=2593676 RepID=UPI002DDBC1B6|nr:MULTISPECIES: hypothetical protein [unclassified Streptomyces]WSC45104.1 hypothetical protein OIE61_14710 [Streptomyces sp. NBC_01762]WSD24764.1 hypothetical protein OHA26_15445 [Streptomyces sp. NBC_01751]